VSAKQRIVALRQRHAGFGCVRSVSGRGGSSCGHGGFGSCDACAVVDVAPASATTAVTVAAIPFARVGLLPGNLVLIVPFTLVLQSRLVAAELSDEVRVLFEGANFGHVATLMPSGAPHSVAVWVGLEGERIAFFTQPASQKARNLARDPRVAISITDHEAPYRTARVRGRVAETLEGEAALEVIDRLSNRYTGKPFPMRSGIVFLVEPAKVGYMELPFEDTPGGRERG
jgi:PPOX class probable F420-dependent enzyme